MKYAKSMYRGGEIVEASLCDYNSAKTLGLICPFCSQAVFLRSGSFYQRKGKEIVSPDSFAHYHSDDPLSLDCELRAKRKDGLEYIERLRIESREQRLKLFNSRLIEVLTPSWQNNIKFIKQVTKIFGKKWIEMTMIQCRQELSQNLAFYLDTIEMMQKDYCNKLKPVDNLSSQIWTAKEISEQNQFYSFVDRQIHLTICQEVLEFLSTRTGGYAFIKILSLGLITASLTTANTMFKKAVGLELVKPMSLTVKKTYSIQNYVQVVCCIIVFTNWLTIYEQLNDCVELSH
jgi:hypothetical protein